MTEKLQNKKELKPKREVQKTLTLEQKIELLEEERKYWQDCRKEIINKIDEFYPQKNLEDASDEMPKGKDVKDVVYQQIFDAFDKINVDFNKRKTELLDQMTPMQRWEWDWNDLQKQKQDWRQECVEMKKNFDEHYKTHKGGGIYYGWLGNDDYYQKQYFKTIEEKLAEQNPKLYAKKMAQLKKQEEKAQEKQIYWLQIVAYKKLKDQIKRG